MRGQEKRLVRVTMLCSGKWQRSTRELTVGPLPALPCVKSFGPPGPAQPDIRGGVVRMGDAVGQLEHWSTVRSDGGVDDGKVRGQA